MATTAVESVVEAKRVLAAVAVTVEARADELSALDAALGDGDHGVSLNIGWRAVMADLDGYDAPDVGALLQGVGLTIVNSVGAAMGPLYGTAFVRAGKAVAGKGTFDGADVAAMLEAARDGIVARGKAGAGHKTMLDAIMPAAEAARHAAGGGAGALETLQAARDAAVTGAVSTRDMIARKGRASRLGERTLGHQDAGASSVALMLDAAVRALDPTAPSETAAVPR
jgi:dihydroxyacetone kinase-like protein